METIESFQKSNLKTVETVVKASLPDQDDVAQEKEIIEAEPTPSTSAATEVGL